MALNNHFRLLIVLLSVAVLSRVASAGTVTVTYHSIGGGTASTTFATGLGVTIPIAVGNNHSYVEISCNPLSDPLGELVVTTDVPGAPSNVVWILVTIDDTLSSFNPSASAAGSWAGILDSRGLIQLRAGIDGNLEGPIDLENNSGLVNIRINATIDAPITGGGT